MIANILIRSVREILVGNPAVFTQTVFSLSCRILWCYSCVTLKLVTDKHGNTRNNLGKGFKLQCNNVARQVDEKCYLYSGP